MIYSKIGVGGAYNGVLKCPPPHPLPSQKTLTVTFASQGDAHMRTDAQIKFLYYPLTL